MPKKQAKNAEKDWFQAVQKFFSIREHLFISLILITALIFRLWLFRANGVIVSAWEAGMILGALKPYFLFTQLPLGNLAHIAFNYFAFEFNYGNLLPYTINAFLMSLFGLPLTEAVLTLPSVLMGVLSVLLVYLIGKEVHSGNAGLLAAAILAFTPWHIIISRTNLPFISISFFTLATVYFFIKYFKEGKFAVLAGLSLGLLVASETYFLVFFALVFLIGLVIQRNSGKKKERFAFIKKIDRKLIIAFLIPLAPLILTQIDFFLDGNFFWGFIGKLFTPSLKLGFQWESLITGLREEGTILLFMLVLIAAIHQGRKLFRLKTESILYFWALIYLIPLLLLGLKLPVEALIYPFIPLVLILGIAFSECWQKKELWWKALNGIAFLALIFSLLSTSFAMNIFTDADFNSGAKTAGYFVRENFGKDVKIFSDLSPTVSRLYFGRGIVADAPNVYNYGLDDWLNYFEFAKNKADVLVLTSAFNSIARQSLPAGFKKNAEILSEGYGRIHNYSKQDIPLSFLSTEEFDQKFNEKYARVSYLASKSVYWHEE